MPTGQMSGSTGAVRRERAERGAIRDSYRIPPFRDGLLRRRSLADRLTQSGDASLVLLVAPPGYGKSTLLAEWAAQDSRTFIWVDADRRCRSEAGLLSAISDAFGDAGWLGARPRGRCTSADLRELARSLDRAARRYVLVLDDAHRVGSSALRSVVGTLLDGLGQGSCVALASRSEPTLPLGRLRTHRTLIEVRSQDLRMTPGEAAGLLRLARVELDFAVIQTLVRQTEGWPAALYLGALTLNGQDDVRAAVDEFDGDNYLVTEYLRDEFLLDLSPELTSFAVRTSVLDELSAPACDAVLQASGSGQILDRLARGNLMLVALDQMHERFRWHPMFRSMLRAELRRTEPRLEPQLHRRASAWLARHGDLDGAISHAVLAGDVGRAGELLWSHLAHYVGLGRVDALRDWVGRFTREELAGAAPLAAAAAYRFLIAGDLDQARYWGLVAAAARAREQCPVPSLDAGIAAIHAATATTDVVSMLRGAREAYELEAAHGPWRPLSCLLMGVAAHLTGERPQAREKLEEGLELSAAAAPGIAALCLAQLTMIAIEQHDWDAARDWGERAAAMVEEHPSLSGWPLSALALAASAATRAHEGRVDEAKSALGRGADLLAGLGDFAPWYGAEARIMLAVAAVALADTVQARRLLAEASRLARRTHGTVIFQPCFDELWGQIDALAETSLSGPASLTIAELRILRFMPSHRSFREIAERLGVSVNTVKTQAHAIYRKLGAGSRSEAVTRASQAGLL